MSRSGYTDDCDGPESNLWRGAVKSAIRGKRGQAMLRELVVALDALPEKRLAPDSLVNEDGEYCALGALGRLRGMTMEPQDPDDVDPSDVARMFGIAKSLAAEVMYLNDEYSADAWKWIDIEICGPMRPHYPDWNRHTRSVRAPNMQHTEQRWRYMREWAAKNIKAQGGGNG